ncbi:hypothetical protein EH222_07580 [candidate division KSB1 bacterium]|nr:MAG: hypothetical protein EH222_07580 [candidate division KSB1 bacterium]
MKTHTSFACALLIAITSAALHTTAIAQTRTVQPDSSESMMKVEQKDVRIFIDKIEIEGWLEKPQAVFILPGQTPDIDDIQIERSFMKELFRPVEKRFTVETQYRPEYSKKRRDVIEW